MFNEDATEGMTMNARVGLSYRLPCTTLFVTGTVTSTDDPLAPDASPNFEATSIEFQLRTSADRRPNYEYEVVPTRGWLFSYKGSFATTTDGRLTTASAESTGHLGTVVASVASIAGTVVGLPRVVARDKFDSMEAVPGTLPPKSEELAGSVPMSAEESHFGRLVGALDTELEAYRNAHPLELERGGGLAAAQVSAANEISRLLSRKAADSDVLFKVGRQRALQRLGDRQLTPIVAHYRAWRELQVTTSVDVFEFAVSLQDLTTQEPHAPRPDPASSPDDQDASTPGGSGPEYVRPESLLQLWGLFGVGVEADWDLERRTEGEPAIVRSTDWSSHPATAVKPNEIVVRHPDMLRIRVVRQVDARLVAERWSRHAVVDEYSRHQVHHLATSWLGRRSLTLSYDEYGLPNGVSTEGSSSAAAGLQSLAGVPQAFADGVDGATSVRSQLAGAQRSGVEAELARIKAEVALRKERLVAAGLDATQGDAVQLERLKQYQALLETQSNIAGADPDLVARLVSDGALDWYNPPPSEGHDQPSAATPS